MQFYNCYYAFGAEDLPKILCLLHYYTNPNVHPEFHNLPGRLEKCVIHVN